MKIDYNIIWFEDIQDWYESMVPFLEEYLEEKGFSLISDRRENGKNIEQLFEGNDFDLVLLDLLMPGLDGFAVMERFKSAGKESDTPILVLTALRDRETRLRALTGGASDFLVKPFDRQEVVSRIHNLLQLLGRHLLSDAGWQCLYLLFPDRL